MDGKYFFGVDLGKGAVKPVDAVGAAIVLAACAAVTGSRRRAEVAP